MTDYHTWRRAASGDRTDLFDGRSGRALSRRAAWLCACLLLGLSACGEEQVAATISVKVFSARAAEKPPAEGEAGWQRLEYSGGVHSAAGSYLVAEKPLLTEWSLVAIKVASQPDGSAAVTGRLNAFSRREVAEAQADTESGRRYLAVQIDGRWADVSPLLSRITDRLTIYGFTTEEAQRLDRYMAER